MTETSPEVTFTLAEAVKETLSLLTGLELTYDPDLSRFRTTTRMLNRALRSNALENEWSYYSDLHDAGTSVAGDQTVWLPPTQRLRIVGDDAVRLIDDDNQVRVWAYILPPDALHKYWARMGLWCAVTRSAIQFSRPFDDCEDGYQIQVPVMREPRMFRLPPLPTDPDTPVPPVSDDILNQPVDFDYPDVVIARAAWLMAQADPVMQPRAQYLEGQFNDLMYQLIERDTAHTDSPYLNDFFVPIQCGLVGSWLTHPHPHSDERRAVAASYPPYVLPYGWGT